MTLLPAANFVSKITKLSCDCISSIQEDQIQGLYMVRRTVCEMLVDRGYLLPSDSCAEEGLTLDQASTRPRIILFVMSFQKVHANGIDFFSVCMCNQFKRYFNGKGHRDLTILASRTSDDDVEQVSDLSALVDPLRPERPFSQNFRTTRCSSLLSLTHSNTDVTTDHKARVFQ